MKRAALCLLAASLLLLTGCRTRTTSAGQQSGTSITAAQAQLADKSAAGARTESGQSENKAGEELGESDARTTENPQAERREYDEDASAQVSVGASHVIHAPGEGEGLAEAAAGETEAVDQLDDKAKRTATQTVPVGEAERKGASEDAAQADSFLLYYTVLLKDRLGSVFECQRKDLYWETQDDYRTVYKTSPEHAWILESGCYDVSARLLEENLTVDAGWVQRKNPGVIVKVVGSSVLGFGVEDTSAAENVRQAMVNRPDWAAIDAVRSQRVVLVSEQLLTSPHLRAAMLVAIAKTAAPDLFADTDVDEALRALSQELNGSPAEGLFIYVHGNE